MAVKYKVTLEAEEKAALIEITRKGKHSVRRTKRAQILLMSDQRGASDAAISEALSVGLSTIYRTKRHFVEYGLEAALAESHRTGQPRKLDANKEALLVSIACSSPPNGHCRWTLKLLGDRLIALTDLESISLETIRSRLKNNDLKPWQEKNYTAPMIN